MQRTIAIACLAVSAGMGLQAFQPPADATAVSEWLKQHAKRLATTEPGGSLDDLLPLKQALKDVRVVGIGEAAHGAREFVRLKHRLVRFLVEELGFNIVALEASYPACLDIDRYVRFGTGDRDQALAGQGFFTWSTTEMSDLLDWLRDYNSKRPVEQRIAFAGFDMQNYAHGYRKVEAFLARAASDYLARTAALPSQPGNQLQQKSDEEKTRLKSAVQDLIGYLALHEIEFTRATTREDYRAALESARIMAQFIDMFTRAPFNPQSPETAGVARRDVYMAQNIEFILNSAPPGSRVIVLAHDSHVSADNLGARMKAMGKHLRDSFGAAYYALGMTFERGGFRTRNMDLEDKQHQGVVALSVGEPEAGTLDWYFSLPHIGNYFVDFRSSVKAPPIEAWMNSPLMMRSIGSGFSMKWPFAQYTEPTVLKQRFDGMVFLESITASTPLDSR